MSVLARFREKTKDYDERFKLIVYGGAGAGKSHFAVSFPNSIYVDTEGLIRYKKFRKMASKNNVAMHEVYSLDELLELVKELLSTKTEFKTLVIDSMSNIFKLECELEAQRLNKKDGKEGTEYGANKARPKRKVLFLVNLLSRLDMNVIITCHKKTKFEKGEEVGNDQDVSTDIEHELGNKWEVVNHGSFPTKARIIKTRMEGLEQNEIIPLTYEYLVKHLGREIFEDEARTVELATKEQAHQARALIRELNYDQEKVINWLVKNKCSSFDELERDKIQDLIDKLKKAKEKRNG